MPEICLFYGIRITMYWSEHNPPHFHAEYGEYEAAIQIENGGLIQGSLPKRQLKLVLAWAEIHKDELMQDWEMCRSGDAPLQINPLM